MKSINVGYENINVEIIDYNTNIAKHAWECYRMTWNDLQNVEYSENDVRVQKALYEIMYMKALPMPREQAIITFRINNISRVCLAQLTRQRKAAFNVESQMPRPVKHNVTIPLNYYHDEELLKKAEKLVKESQDLYDLAISKGIPPQDARYLLMHSQTTSCVYVVDINTFVNSFGFRCENNLSDEINLVYRLCLSEFKKKLKNDKMNNIIDNATYEFYMTILQNCDCSGAKQHIGKNTDMVFGNSFKRFPDANEEVTNATINCDYDYKKSAWYYELKRLYDTKQNLLFYNEKEMIEKM